MSESVDKEIEAIKAVLKALDALSPEARTSVLEYVVKRLQISVGTAARPADEGLTDVAADLVATGARFPEPAAPMHIRDLKEKKQPRSANEMAALVAFFLSHVVPAKDRKSTITTKDIETYFKIAEFRLPEKVQFTLPNAKAAGYLDAVGNGEYKLNAVGHNLVVHSMPRGSGTERVAKKRPSKKRTTAKKR